MTSHTRVVRTLALWSSVAAMLWFAGTSRAQELHGEALVKALQKGGYVLVMRHASSPREVPDKQTANIDNSEPERQLDESGRKSAVAMGKALRDLGIPISAATNTIVVTHLPNIAAAFPQLASGLPDGEALMFAPDGKGQAILAARVKIEEWPAMHF